jgi:hypothetical protein
MSFPFRICLATALMASTPPVASHLSRRPPILDVAARGAIEAFRFKLLADLGAGIETLFVKGKGAFAGGNGHGSAHFLVDPDFAIKPLLCPTHGHDIRAGSIDSHNMAAVQKPRNALGVITGGGRERMEPEYSWMTVAFMAFMSTTSPWSSMKAKPRQLFRAAGAIG